MLPVTIDPCCGMPTASISVGRSAIRPPLLLPGPQPSCTAETNTAAAFSPPTWTPVAAIAAVASARSEGRPPTPDSLDARRSTGHPTTPPTTWPTAVLCPGDRHGGRLQLSYLGAHGRDCIYRFSALRARPRTASRWNPAHANAPLPTARHPCPLTGGDPPLFHVWRDLCQRRRLPPLMSFPPDNCRHLPFLLRLVGPCSLCWQDKPRLYPPCLRTRQLRRRRPRSSLPVPVLLQAPAPTPLCRLTRRLPRLPPLLLAVVHRRQLRRSTRTPARSERSLSPMHPPLWLRTPGRRPTPPATRRALPLPTLRLTETHLPLLPIAPR